MTASVGVAVVVLGAVMLWWPDPGRRLRSLMSARRTPASAATSRAVAAAARRRFARQWEYGEVDPALVLDLMAAALSGGAPPDGALDAVGSAVGGTTGAYVCGVAARLRLGSTWKQAWSDVPLGLIPLRRTLGLAAATGAPGAALLRDAAEDVRRHRHRQEQAQAGRLGVRMVLPLGLCALPAFVAWAVVPVVLSLAGQMLSG